MYGECECFVMHNIDPAINYPNSDNQVKYPIILTSHSLRSLIEIMIVYQCGI